MATVQFTGSSVADSVSAFNHGIAITKPGTVVITPDGDINFYDFYTDCGGIQRSIEEVSEAMFHWVVVRLKSNLESLAHERPQQENCVASPDPLLGTE